MLALRSLVLLFALLARPAWAAGPVAAQPARPSQKVPAIPEPAALALFVLGAGVVGVAIRRRQG